MVLLSHLTSFYVTYPLKNYSTRCFQYHCFFNFYIRNKTSTIFGYPEFDCIFNFASEFYMLICFHVTWYPLVST